MFPPFRNLGISPAFRADRHIVPMPGSRNAQFNQVSHVFPLSDDDRLLVKPAYVTWTLVGLNVLVFLLQMSNPEFTLGYAAIPAEITKGQDLVGLVPVQVGSVQDGTAQVVELPQAPGPSPIQLTLLTAMFYRRKLPAEPDTVFGRHYARDPRTRRLW